MKSGIYEIINTITNDRYIGSSVDIERRIKYHKRQLSRNKHWNQHLQNSWNKHDYSSFVFQIIEETDNLVIREQYYIDKEKPKYNICPTAYSTAGRTLSEEHKRKLSMALKGRTLPKETCIKISKAGKGRILSEEHKRRIGIASTGRMCSEERKRKIGDKSKGRKHTEESKRKISIAQLGKKHSKTTKILLKKIAEKRTRNKINGRYESNNPQI